MKSDRSLPWRYFLQDRIRQEVDFSRTGQNLGTQPPPIQKPHPPDARTHTLPDPRKQAPVLSLASALASRRSLRTYQDTPLAASALSFLLWSAQGINDPTRAPYHRTAPSAGGRHALETYLAVQNAEDLETGLYRYLPLDHALLALESPSDLSFRLFAACLGQRFVQRASVVFLWSAVYDRMAWRYGEASAKVIALDAGHACQNVCLASEAVGAGACPIAAYHQDLCDTLLSLDGHDEFVVYLAAVGSRLSKR